MSHWMGKDQSIPTEISNKAKMTTYSVDGCYKVVLH